MELKGKISKRIETALRAVLPRSVVINSIATNDSMLELEIAGRRVLACWAGEGWLRQIRPVLTDFRDCPDIVVVRRMSPGGSELLSKEGIGWVDELGAAEIAIDSIIVSRTGRPDQAPKKPRQWTPSVIAVAEAILCDDVSTVADMERATGLSTGSCTNALRVLTDQGYLKAEIARGPASRRSVVDKEQLLDAYAKAAALSVHSIEHVVGVTWRDPIEGLAEIGRKWDKMQIGWVASGTVAAALLAPLITTLARADVYVDAHSIAELDSIALQVGLQPIEGGRLTLKPFPSVTTRLLAQTIEGVHIAPWPRVYVDLRKIGVRGEEAAEHLREVKIG